MNQVRLYGKPIRVNKASADKQKTVEVGAELFIGNLDPMVTEQTLYDTFGRFGSLVSAPKVFSPSHKSWQTESLYFAGRSGRCEYIKRLWLCLLLEL